MEYSWLDARLNLSLLVDGQRTAPLPEGLPDRLWRPRLAFSPVTTLDPLDSQADQHLRFRVAPDNRIVASRRSEERAQISDFREEFKLPLLTDRSRTDGNSHSRRIRQRQILILCFRFCLHFRLNFALCCNIDFIYYPFDVHVCDMSIVNVDSDDHQSILRWIGDEQSPFRVSEKSIHFASDFGEGTFNFLGLLPLFVVDDLPGGRRRTRLVLRAAFRRQLLAVLIDPLGPSLFPVLLSWTGFWLDPRRPVPRAALMALSFVILEHQQVSHFASRAQDHQLRSIDVWYLICRCFIIAALLQYVLILHTVRAATPHTDLWKCKNACTVTSFNGRHGT
ncbi:gamma-aminobutyric acid receptor subunit rho-2-like [Dermacentor silvarum]|uniref:gamma-aminobutyric acid receptor subunit rho-2-like n=1 Tax=Dermacentor silvarum TaxID=543639 RepID=UPI002100B389|nr:gamma-aminobutyric acid receptor subunit rho-2-like [Dermacentor silvarum]